MNQQVIIGIECHLQLNKVNTKLFCGCALPKEDSEPNTHCCQICLGHPGTKPAINKKAIEHALKLALALNCTISDELIFSRKNYFFNDLPKNFQITQYELPLGKGGFIELDSGKKIRLKRVHIEEDPGALLHKADYCLIDYNRSGIPLCEVVTEPDLNSPKEVREFLKKLLSIVEYLGVFDATTGTMRADANINIKGYERVELKNINGLKEIDRAITYEIERQKKLISEGSGVTIRETRGWDADKGLTIFQRKKESEEDYGYIIEGDLPAINLKKEFIEKIRKKIPELAQAKAERLITQYKLSREEATVLSAEMELANLFERTAKEINPVLAARWLIRDLNKVLTKKKKTLEEVKIDEKHLIELLNLLENQKITDITAKALLEQLMEKPFSPKKYVEEKGLSRVADAKEITKICEKIVKENAKAVQDYKNGRAEALDYLVGKVMAVTRGKASPETAKKIMRDLLKQS